MMSSLGTAGRSAACHTNSSSGSSSRVQAASLPLHSRLPGRHVPSVTQRLRSQTTCRSTTAAAQHLALHIGETTIQLPFSPAQAQQLDADLAKLLQTFADKQAAKRPKRWDMMEVRFKGPEAGSGLELLELFCNPNAHATAFDAKLLVTIQAAGGLKVMSEGRLSAIKADLDAYLASQ
ncbi:hypothetical protein OEZ85_009611 [Tetradesmus obliquus]|uniref:Uncharacterized protein n=1 Tax=Tetradesmus obliquus TaxID=3088 RepID=A0ABY8U9Z5_TETOB|nr:hypothetical protein OEZ85_009611 [Tetradesmus obliquus]